MIWFDEDDVVRRAPADVYELGLDYVDETCLMVSSDEVVATVGSDDKFRVRLTGTEGRLMGECSCLEGRRGVFCVHCVAAAVMAVDVTQPPDVEALLSQVNALREPRRLVGPSLLSWAEDANLLLPDLEMGAVYHPAMVRPLYQQLLWHVVDKTYWFESEEEYPALMEVRTRVLEGLAEACQEAPPEPGELARWLVDLQIDQPDSAAEVQLSEVVELLGPQGLDAYRRCMEKLHRSLPAIDDEQDEPEPQATRRMKIRELREEFLRTFEPDVDTMVAFFAEDISDPTRHLSMAEELYSAGRFEEAISWLERVDRKYLRRDVLMAELYTATGRHREAARLRWQVFERFPSKYNYDQLLAAAEPLNAVEYARNRAFGFLRKLDGRIADEAVLILLHEAGLAIDERRNYRQAAQLLAELQEMFRREGGNFTACLERFKTTHGHHRDLLRALAEAGL
jgi:tetratricopeptide (TPR) repeat protein